MSATPAVSERLSHLLALADQGPALRTALAEEVADLLIHWPADCPPDTRAMFESLLARCARDADTHVQARLRVQLCTNPALAARVLPRAPVIRMLVETARNGGDITSILAEALEMDVETARCLLNDKKGTGLALACKRAGIERAAFSALVMTRHQSSENCQALLDCFDAVAGPAQTVSPPPAPDAARVFSAA